MTDAVLVTLIGAAANIGAVGIIGKYVLNSVEKHNQQMPVVMKTLTTMEESIKELFRFKNEHAEEIVEVRSSIEHCPGCRSGLHGK